MHQFRFKKDKKKILKEYKWLYVMPAHFWEKQKDKIINQNLLKSYFSYFRLKNKFERKCEKRCRGCGQILCIREEQLFTDLKKLHEYV